MKYEEVSFLVPLTEEQDVTELVDMFAVSYGLEDGRYLLVPLTEEEPYQAALSMLMEENAVTEYDPRTWVLTFDPEKDPTIDEGEESFPKALRVLRKIPLH